ncbi:hypothetical protein IFM89_026965 [Coptis chinensis]|uniref:Uncharacterized protein n=1 Tax=Coptis chinensis TaxID=261450 RepID=A0A835M546_9MAGN|nr:hypothetical protein IFM89_026965 [Coptis chinensis]
MVEAIVSAVIDQLASVIRNEVEQKVRLVVGVRKEVEKLETNLTLIKAVLEDAEKKEIHENAVKIWLEDLKDVMYDADDVLDEWNTQILISRIEGFPADGSYVANKMCSYLLSPCACLKHGGARYDIARRIKDIRERLAEIFGRDHDKQEILSVLLCETSQQETQVRIPILSIVGTGGFGKTTLAQLVYNEGTITTTFELKIWVCVSEPFDRERIAREIIAHATGEKLPENIVGWDLLHQHLCNSVKGKRFLLVLDDVWTEDSNSLGAIEVIFEMVVSEEAKSSPPHVTRQIAFSGKNTTRLRKIEGIGQELAKKCKGVPLAVKTLASLMRFKRKQKKIGWVISGYDGARELERVGVEYFDVRGDASFFQDFKKDDDGNIVECKMHDLVHDFAESLTKTDCYVLVNNGKICSDKIRHLTVDDVENPSIYEAKKLRTLLVGKAFRPVPSALYQLTCLRTLDLSGEHFFSGSNLEVLPSEVSRLLHLRYLDLSYTIVKELPETTSEVEDTNALKYYPRGGIERLSHLRTLSKFVVSDGSSKGSVIGELGNLNFLKGRLDITGLKHVKSVNEAKHAELHKKNYISDLRLNFGYDEIRRDIGDVSSEEEIRRMEGVLENLEPHKESLERLEIRNYVGSTLPTWMMSNITYLVLWDCPNLKVEPHYLFPPLLETLVLWWDVGVLSKSLMSLTHNNNNLKTLCIFGLPHSSLPQGLNQLTSLQELNFLFCYSLDFKPEELKPLTMLRKLFIDASSVRTREEDWSILTHIPTIVIDYQDIKRSIFD